MFCDLNQPWNEDVVEAKQKVVTAMKLGFGCVALNHVARSKQELQSMDMVDSFDLDSMIQVSRLDNERNARIMSGAAGIQQRKRLTFCTDNADEAQILMHTSKSRKLRKWDIIACCPLSDETLKLACESLEIDILSLDPQLPCVFHAKQSVLKTAISRGIILEVCCYPSLFRGAAERQSFCSFVSKYTSMTHAKRTIFTTGAPDAKQLRSPYDLINMAVYMGFTKTQAQKAVSSTCEEVLKCASERRLKSGVSAFKPVPGETVQREAKRARREKSGDTK